MLPRTAYRLIYDPEARAHLARIERKYHSLIRDQIKELLSFEPEREARNRKPLCRPSVLGTAWEIRFGPGNSFRVFYRVDPEKREVLILAIGTKRGNRLMVGGKEFEL